MISTPANMSAIAVSQSTPVAASHTAAAIAYPAFGIDEFFADLGHWFGIQHQGCQLRPLLHRLAGERWQCGDVLFFVIGRDPGPDERAGRSG